MTRVALSLFLTGLALVLGILTCVVQTHNHERAAELSRKQREFEMLDAANAQADAVVSAHVWGVPNEALDVTGKARAASRRQRGVQQ